MGSVNGARRPQLSISARPWAQEGATLAIAGDLDVASVTTLRDAVHRALHAGHRHLVVDLSATTFLDCAAIEALLQAVRPLQHDAGAAIVFAAPSGTVRRLLTILQFDAIIGMVDSAELAIRACQQQPIRLPDGWRHGERAPR